MAQYPQVEIKAIEKLSISIKKGAAKISFEVPIFGPDLLKLIYLEATAQPLQAVISSPQAQMDLIITPVKIKTGEIGAVPAEVNGK